MDDSTIKKLQKRAYSAAIKHGYPELADDFSSQVFVYILEKPDRGATIDQLFIDFLRSTYGRPGTPCGDARINGRRNTISLDQQTRKTDKNNRTLFSELIGDTRDNSGHEFRDGQFYYCFRGREAEIYKLYYIENLKEEEIAGIFDITGSRVSQILSLIKKRIEVEAIFHDGKSRMEWDESFLEYSISWLKI